MIAGSVTRGQFARPRTRTLLAAEEGPVGARVVKIAVTVAVVGNNDGYREILGVTAPPTSPPRPPPHLDPAAPTTARTLSAPDRNDEPPSSGLDGLVAGVELL